MAGEPQFSHITVSADDDDDVVIQAGARSTRPVASTMPSDGKPGERSGLSTDPRPEAVEKPSAAGDARPKRKQAEEYRETVADDLEPAPMPLAQKIILVLAAVGVIAVIAFLTMR